MAQAKDATMMRRRRIYCVVVRRGKHARYSYGATLREAIETAKPRAHEQFAYARFDRALTRSAEINGWCGLSPDRITTWKG